MSHFPLLSGVFSINEKCAVPRPCGTGKQFERSINSDPHHRCSIRRVPCWNWRSDCKGRTERPFGISSIGFRSAIFLFSEMSMGRDTAHTRSFNTDLPVPVSFRSFDISNGFTESTSLVSLFHDALVITSPKRLRQGRLLSIRIRMPPERLGGNCRHCR